MSNRLFWTAMAVLGGGLVLLVVNDDSRSVFGVSNSVFARVLYLGVLGGVIAAAFVSGRRHFGKAARNIAIWLFIVLVLVTGYQYRYELQDVASRVTAGLIPGSPITLAGGDDRTRVMLQKSANGHFEVRATVNGEPVRFLVDTGATNTVLSAADAARAGYDVGRLEFALPVATANGYARAARVTVRDLSLGPIERRSLPVLVAAPGRLGQSLLGMDFIGSLSGFDMRGDRIILSD